MGIARRESACGPPFVKPVSGGDLLSVDVGVIIRTNDRVLVSEERAMGAPQVQRLEHWTLVSSDVERTKRFYVDVLGAKEPQRTGTGNGPVSVDLAGTLIDFFPAGGDREPMPGSGGQHHAYIIRLEDYDPWVEQFEKH